MQEKEIWKPIEGYSDYMVSDQGRIKSIKFGKERILKPHANKTTGYLQCCFRQDGKQKLVFVHRLVAIAFVQNDDPEHKTDVSHLDESRDNNCASNLCWATTKENLNMPLFRQRASAAKKGKKQSPEHIRHSAEARRGLKRSEGFKKKMSEVNSKKIYCPELNRTFNSLTEAARVLGCSVPTISCCLTGRLKSICKKKYHVQYVS